MAIQTLNPATGKVEKKFTAHTKKQVDAALARAARTAKVWQETSLTSRRVRMRAVAKELRKNRERYARTITNEMGKLYNQSLAEIDKCADLCDYYAAQAEFFLAPQTIKTTHKKSYVRHDPLGVVFAVMPWNFPFWQVFRFAAPALMAGNVGVLKHASNVPQSALAIERVFRRAGFPPGAFATILVESSAVERIIADKRVAAVTLTGSVAAGEAVASHAGKHLKKTVLELGGSDAFVVLKDADIDAAVATGVMARTFYCGQSCIAAKRFIVEQKVLKQFTEKFATAMADLRVGDPMDDASQVGPLAAERFVDDLHRQVRTSVRQGAKLLTGGKRPKGAGAYYEPTVLGNVKPGMVAYHEELFGPVASIIAAKDAEDAIRIASDSNFGLGGTIFSRNIKRAEKLASKMETGTVYINGMMRSDIRLPFGGIKRSGYGRELGPHGIKEFVNVKTVVVT